MSGPAAPAAAGPVQDGPPPLKGRALVLATMVLALANFMAILDTTIVNVSIPAIAGSLAISPAQGAWAITSYSVSEAIMVPLTGFLATRFGAVRVMVTCMALFGVFSALAGASPTFEVLVLFRVLQGLAGGPMMPMSQTLLMSIFPPERRGTGVAIWMMTTVLGPVFGPIIGGNFADTIGWHWAFYINVPIVIGAVFFVSTIFKGRETPTRKARFDVVGVVLLVVWVGALQIMLDTGKENGWFDSLQTWVLAGVALTGFIAFVIWELTDDDPAVNLKVFRSVNFTSSTILLAIVFAVFFGTIVLMPLWLQTNLNYTATWAGYAIALTGITAAMAAPVVARLMRVVDPRFLITFALLWLALMAWYRSQLPPDANFWALAAPQLFQGIAMPCLFIPLNQLALAELTLAELPGGAGLVTFIRTTAGAFAASVVTTLWDNAALLHRAELVGAMTPGTPQFDAALASAIAVTGSTLGGDALMERILQNQAVMVATSHMFALSVAALLVTVPAIWILRKPKILMDAPAH
jgi:MFS transporter, DHA2 family, multidrug resistance protein